MIDKSEIMEFSREFGLRANVIEKDYVLGWLLDGIFNHKEIGTKWAFKLTFRYVEKYLSN